MSRKRVSITRSRPTVGVIGLAAATLTAAFVTQAGAQQNKKPAPKSTAIVISAPDDIAKSNKNQTLLDNAAVKMEDARKRAEGYEKSANETTAKYKKDEGAVREAADKLVAAYLTAKTINEELAEAYRGALVSKIEPLLEKQKAISQDLTFLRDAPGVRTAQASCSAEDVAAKEKTQSAAVTEAFDQWVAARKTAADAAKEYADTILASSIDDAKAYETRDKHNLAQADLSAQFLYLKNMQQIKQRRATDTSPARVAELTRAEEMAKELLNVTKAQNAAYIKSQKLSRLIDEQMAEIRQAVSEANAAARPSQTHVGPSSGSTGTINLNNSSKPKPAPTNTNQNQQKKKTGH